MKKKLGTALILAALSAMMVACGSAEPKEVDTKDLAAKLISDGVYTETPEIIPSDEIEYYMEVEEGVEGIMYMSGGTTGEEVAVFTAPNEEAAIAMKANVEEFLADQSSEMGAYDPKVVQRIENAVLEQNGKYVILCVSDDSAKAQKIIEEAFGK